jgi:hypothetical protein
VDSEVNAQPLLVANLSIPGGPSRNGVFVATEKDSVYAFDADASPCVQLWRTTLVSAGEEAVPAPNLEITTGEISHSSASQEPRHRCGFLHAVCGQDADARAQPVYRQRIFALLSRPPAC